MKPRKGKAVVCAVSITAVIAGLVVAGCGDSSSAEPLNRSQFVQEASSICRSADAERSEALEGAADGAPTVDELAADALPSVEEMTEELADLNVPVGERSEVQAIVKAFEAAIKEVQANPADPTAAIGAFTKANQLAEDYGLPACAI